MSDRDKIEGMRRAGRKLLIALWRRHKRGEPLGPKEEKIVRILEEHPEFSEFWQGTVLEGSVEIDGKIINPFLHVQMHSMVESQLEAGKPPEVSRTLDRLVEAGLSRHEAIHRIVAVLVPELYKSMAGKMPLREESYAALLRNLEP